MRNLHILRTLLILHLFWRFKIFWGIIWLRCCLNRFITLRSWSNDIRKTQIKKYKKIHKGSKNVRNPHILRTLPILYFFGLFRNVWGIIWLVCCLNRFVTLRRWSNDMRKNRNKKILKNSQWYKECEESSHCSYPPNSPLVWNC